VVVLRESVKKPSSKLALFVVNQTESIQTFIIENQRGAKNLVTVPKTWIPIDLSLQAKRSDIIVSPNYRKVISLKNIKPIDEETAHKILSTPEARAEAETLTQNSIRGNANPNPIAKLVETNTAVASKDDVIIAGIMSLGENRAISEFRHKYHANQLDKNTMIKLMEEADNEGYVKLARAIEKVMNE
jgi:hypothetical protein